MKKRLPAIVTLVLIAVALALLTQRERLSGPSNWMLEKTAVATPEDAVWRMSDAARAGDVRAYLDCFSGALKQSLQKTATDMGEAQFSQYLKKLHEEMTGIAVSDLEQVNEQTATLSVEFVFRGKNETQKHRFKRVDGAWKIDGVDAAEHIKPLIPYGADASGKE